MTTSIMKVGEPLVYMTDFSGDKQNEHQKIGEMPQPLSNVWKQYI